MGVGQRALSLHSHGGGTPPPPGPGEGGGFLTIRERASTPSFTQEVLVAGALSAAAFAGGVGGMDLGRGDDVVCVRRRL